MVISSTRCRVRRLLVLCAFCAALRLSPSSTSGVNAFQIPSRLKRIPPKVFGFFTRGSSAAATPVVPPNSKLSLRDQQKQAILKAVSYTENGKTASAERQRRVLSLVRELETSYPPPEDLLEGPAAEDPTNSSNKNDNKGTAIELLDGTWYLQYTSPSEVEDDVESLSSSSSSSFLSKTAGIQSNNSPLWKPRDPEEGSSRIETPDTMKRKFQARGSVSAAGITVDTSQRVTRQIINTRTSTVLNAVQIFGSQNDSAPHKSFNSSSSGTATPPPVTAKKFSLADWFKVHVKVGGKFRPSPRVSNRVIVAFDTARIELTMPKLNAILQQKQERKNDSQKETAAEEQQDTVAIDFGWVFDILALGKGGIKDNGWLETTYVDKDMRIGRGNKGTMFILTKDPGAVKP